MRLSMPTRQIGMLTHHWCARCLSLPVSNMHCCVYKPTKSELRCHIAAGHLGKICALPCPFLLMHAWYTLVR